MASKYVRCPGCGLKTNCNDNEPEFVSVWQPFEIECERCKTRYEVTPVRMDIFYTVGEVTYVPKGDA